jgi:antitoxin PrlF
MITSKAQTTVPQAVRLVLGAGAGDEIAYSILDGKVLLSKAPSPAPRRGVPFEDPFVAFWEWDTPEDNEAYKDL